MFIGIILTSCGGGKSDAPENPQKITPDAALLTFPEQNALCISGAGNSDNESMVVFKWNTAKNAVAYDVSVKNLVNGSLTTLSSDKSELAISILRSTPYSWFVISKSKDGLIATSPTWKFYNSGAGVVSYPPFPADEMAPASGVTVMPENGKIKLSWKGSDTDNDILNYDVYFGTLASPPLLSALQTAQSLNEVSVVAKTKYYWKVVSRDSKGNTSDSDVVQFSTP